ACRRAEHAGHADCGLPSTNDTTDLCDTTRTSPLTTGLGWGRHANFHGHESCSLASTHEWKTRGRWTRPRGTWVLISNELRPHHKMHLRRLALRVDRRRSKRQVHVRPGPRTLSLPDQQKARR